MRGGAVFVLFCGVGAAFTRYVGVRMWRTMSGSERAARTARHSYRAWAVLAAIGLAVLLVGFIAWVTGTTFHST